MQSARRIYESQTEKSNLLYKLSGKRGMGNVRSFPKSGCFHFADKAKYCL